MWKNIALAWRLNHGTQLSVVALVASLIMCLLWYKQWVPEIQISSAAANPILAKTTRPQSSIFIAQVTAPPMKGRTLRGVILLFPPSGTVTEAPIYSQRFELDVTGQTTLVGEVTPGTYAAVAFIDLNDDNQLNLDENGVPIEPFRLSQGTVTSGGKLGKLDAASFLLKPHEPFVCQFDFTTQ